VLFNKVVPMLAGLMRLLVSCRSRIETVFHELLPVAVVSILFSEN
jgi:hypothetical protein